MEVEIAKIKWLGGYNYKSDRYNNFGIVESLEEVGKEFKVSKKAFGSKYSKLFKEHEDNSSYFKNLKIILTKKNSEIISARFLVDGGFKDLNFEKKIKVIEISSEDEWIEYIPFFSEQELKKIIEEPKAAQNELFLESCSAELRIKKFLKSSGFDLSEYIEIKNLKVAKSRLDEIFCQKFSKIPFGYERIMFISENLKIKEISDLLKNILEQTVIPEKLIGFLDYINLVSDNFKEVFFDILFSSKNIDLKDRWNFFKTLIEKGKDLKKIKLIDTKNSEKFNNFIEAITAFENFNKNISIENLLKHMQSYQAKEKSITEKMENLMFDKITKYLWETEASKDFQTVNRWFEGKVVFETESLNHNYDILRFEIFTSRDNENPFKEIEAIKKYLSENKKPYIEKENTCLQREINYFFPFKEVDSSSEIIKFYNNIFRLYDQMKNSRYVEMLLFDYCENKLEKSYNYIFQIFNEIDKNELCVFQKKFINKICLLTGMKQSTKENIHRIEKLNKFKFSKNVSDFQSEEENENKLNTQKQKTIFLALGKRIDEVPNSNIKVTIHVSGISNYQKNHHLEKKKEEPKIEKNSIEIANVTDQYLQSENFYQDLINLIPGYNRNWDKVNSYSFFYEFFDSYDNYREGVWEILGTDILSNSEKCFYPETNDFGDERYNDDDENIWDYDGPTEMGCTDEEYEDWFESAFERYG